MRLSKEKISTAASVVLDFMPLFEPPHALYIPALGKIIFSFRYEIRTKLYKRFKTNDKGPQYREKILQESVYVLSSSIFTKDLTDSQDSFDEIR